MKFVNRIKNKVKSWLVDKLVFDPEEDCPLYDACREKFEEGLSIEDIDPEPYIPWSDLD